MQLIKQLLQFDENQVFKFVRSLMSEHYGKQIYFQGNHYIYAEGNSNICLVSHIDTMRDERTELKIIEDGDIIRAEDDILGGDDRLGVAMMLELMAVENKPNLLFCNGEERGCTGVRKFIEDFYYFPSKKVSLFIELDRRGENDAVTYNEISSLFIRENRFCEKFGFTDQFGTSSDIYYLTEFYSIPSVNLSVGFFNEHSIDEYINLEIYRKAKERVKLILQEYRTPETSAEWNKLFMLPEYRYGDY